MPNFHDRFETCEQPVICMNVSLNVTPCNTSVERGYSFLQMVCVPRHNHLKPEHLEI